MNTNKEQEELLISWLSVIGAITLFWSLIERSIDQIVYVLHKNQDASQKKKKPMRLDSKLEYIKLHSSTDVISKDNLETLINQTKKTVKIRDICVHGMLEDFDESSIKIGKVQGRDEKHLIEIFIIDRERLDISANNMKILSQDWSKLAELIVIEPRNGYHTKI